MEFLLDAFGQFQCQSDTVEAEVEVPAACDFHLPYTGDLYGFLSQFAGDRDGSALHLPGEIESDRQCELTQINARRHGKTEPFIGNTVTITYLLNQRLLQKSCKCSDHAVFVLG